MSASGRKLRKARLLISDTAIQSLIRLSARFNRRRITDERSDAIVSLTTYGHRLRTVHLGIESIAWGKSRPSRILLWLNTDEMVAIPRALRRLSDRGLEILGTPDLGPHKKYYPYVSTSSDLASPLVTADDDVIYPRRWLSDLLAAHHSDRESVHCHRAWSILIKDDAVAPYLQWRPCTSTTASHSHFTTGVSGVLYPVRAQEVLRAAGDDFVNTCFRADDVWINAKVAEAGIRVRQIRSSGPRFPLIRGTQAEALWRTNIRGESQNDEYIKRTYSREALRRVLLDAEPATKE
ncbi:hypothetical protein [uncultured Jatrophihabitans sp.]|uniref:hypothetical protein n=1 Tax=uncultured Jatrophihabitans sp. TaxID=1610747 RepID=UPI0035C9FF01